MTKATTVQKLAEFGQSIWLDNISRAMIDTGSLKKMIKLGVRGMTSNPTIFDKTVSSSSDYDERIEELFKGGKSTFEIYDDLTVRDVRDAADIFKAVYDETERLDGYVSLEVSPKLAHTTKHTVEEAKRLHKKVNRPNVMFKIPATDAGFPAIEELLSEGININVTLLFSVQQYVKTAEVYLRGLNKYLQKGGDLSNVHSVASVFVSRVDTVADSILEARIANGQDEGVKDRLGSLKGRAAVANSKLIYNKYSELLASDEFKKLKKEGANLQRVLWASTSTKNPLYSNIKYVTELIAKNTVNTIPENTLQAYLDHGVVEEAVTEDASEAKKIIEGLKNFVIDIDVVCNKLLQDGVIAFERSFDSLLSTIEEKTKTLCKKS